MEKQSFSDGLFSPLGIKRVIFMLVRPEWSLNKYFFSKKLGLGSI